MHYNIFLPNVFRYLRGQDAREHFSHIEKNPLTAIATLLDPRWKTAGFNSKENAQTAKKILVQLAYTARMQKKKAERCTDSKLTETAEGAVALEPDDKQANESDVVNQNVKKVRL